VEICHGLVDGLDAETHSKLFDQLLRRFVKVNLPAVVTFGDRKFDSAMVHLFR
jgi:hypothetical protein